MNQLGRKILEEIRNQGPISFSRFMELALYCPVYGYYEKEEDTLGRRGDYFTSVSVGPLFGQLLALQFSDWLRELRGPACLVEAGAHRGELAGDILHWLGDNQADLLDCLEYLIVEPSARRQQWQRMKLTEFAPRVRWVNSLEELTRLPSSTHLPQGLRGVIFSNELLDAMPVRRFGWDAGRRTWFEWGVQFLEERFQWARLEPGAVPDGISAREWPEEIIRNLPDGFTVELNTAACRWWAGAARLLAAGKLVTLDYGMEQAEWMAPERMNGTLRAYRGHHLVDEILSNPGEQDITAHVNFSSIQKTGEAAGLTTAQFLTQEAFLTRIAAPALEGIRPFGEWTSARVRQFQTLTHPSQLGRSFRVLVQSR